MITRTKNQLRRLLPGNTFARGVGVLVGGTAGAQLLTVLAAPLLTRLYSPEDFGLLAVYASLLTLIGVISSLRYELAIPLPEDDGEAANVAALSLILVGINSLLSGVLVWQLGPAIADALGVPALASYLWLLPVGVLIGGAYTVFNYWAIRAKRFSTIAGTKLRQTIATIAIQLAAFKLGGIALLYAQVAGQSIGTTSLGRTALVSAGFRQVTWGGIVMVAVRYRRFPIFSSWEALVNNVANQLPAILFASFFGPVFVGLYALSHRVLLLPMTVVGAAIDQVFLSNAPTAYRSGTLGALVHKLHFTLSSTAIPPALLIIFLGQELFAFAFGETWIGAGEVAQWMAPWIYFQFVSSPISTVFAVRERLREALLFQVISLIARFAAILVGVWIGDFITAIAIFSVTSGLCYIGLLFWTVMLAENRQHFFLLPDLKARWVK